jgi:hypothetical protein
MKRDILKDADYRFDFDRAMYVNHAAKKAFSLEFIDDHSENELVRRIGEHTQNGWTFYFNNSPSESVKRELERVLG